MTSVLVNTLKKRILIGRMRGIGGKINRPIRRWIISTATKKLGLNIVTREELSKNTEKYNVLLFGLEETIVASESCIKKDELPELFKSKIGRHSLKKAFVSEVVNAELVGPTAVGFDQSGDLISQTVLTEDYIGLRLGLPTQTLILKKLPSFRTLQLDTVCSLVNCWGNNYFHWIVDCLTRIEGAEYYQEQTGRKPILIINSNPTTWQKESLSLLGYEPDDCIQWNMSKVKVKRLVVPSFRREEYLVSPAACHWIRQRVFSNLPVHVGKNSSFSSRVYISRPKTAGRQVINENDVMEALAPFGFVAYTLEKMSFADEVRLFAQAEIVVATHGAGLTNMIFAQNLTVVELFGSWLTPLFFNLAKLLGFQYRCLASDSNGKKQHSEQYSGVTVDVSKLRELVAEIL